jgi:hypothetical protein
VIDPAFAVSASMYHFSIAAISSARVTTPSLFVSAAANTAGPTPPPTRPPPPARPPCDAPGAAGACWAPRPTNVAASVSAAHAPMTPAVELRTRFILTSRRLNVFEFLADHEEFFSVILHFFGKLWPILSRVSIF